MRPQRQQITWYYYTLNRATLMGMSKWITSVNKESYLNLNKSQQNSEHVLFSKLSCSSCSLMRLQCKNKTYDMRTKYTYVYVNVHVHVYVYAHLYDLHVKSTQCYKFYKCGKLYSILCFLSCYVQQIKWNPSHKSLYLRFIIIIPEDTSWDSISVCALIMEYSSWQDITLRYKKHGMLHFLNYNMFHSGFVGHGFAIRL